MARLTSQTRGQLAAIAQVRWHMFTHSLRTTKGALELFSRIVISIVIVAGGLGGAVLLGVAAWYFVSHGRPEGLALLLWPVFLFWQFFPVMATALTETMDSSDLLRFPLNYPAYVLVRLVYGALDPATVLGTLWLLGITLGFGWARPGLLFLWTALVLAIFAAVNLLLTQMIFAWVERWLAQRRTREIFAVLFFLAMISLQLVGPMLSRYGEHSSATLHKISHVANPVQAMLPPGIAAASIVCAADGRYALALTFLAGLLLYAAAILRVLGVRLSAQYRGENLSEVSRDAALHQKVGVQPGWTVPGLSGPVAAVFEKELRYLARSGPMLLTFVTPIIMLVVFGMRGGSGGFLSNSPDLTLPIGAAYALLLLTNLIYNTFGADGGGVQFFLASPVSFRSVVLGKNLAHMAVLGAEVLVLAVGVSLFRPPSLLALAMTVTGLLFAAPINLAAGNLLSLYSPKKIEFATFGRQRASQLTVLASLVLQILIFGIGALTVFLARSYARPWLAVILFLLLAAISFVTYLGVLTRIDPLAQSRREILTTELCR